MCKAQVFSRASERVTSVTGRGKTAKPTTLLIGKDEGAAEPLAVCPADDGGKSRRVEPLIFADFSEVRVSNPSAEMGVGRFSG